MTADTSTQPADSRPKSVVAAARGQMTGRGAVVVFGAKVANAVVGFVLAIVIARALGPTGRAQYFLASTLAAGAFTICHLSLDFASFWALAERRATLRDLVGPMLRSGAPAIAVACGGYVAIGVGADVLRASPDATVAWGLVLVPAMLIRFWIDGMLWAAGRVRLVSAALLLTAVSQAAAVGTLAAEGRLDSTAVLAVSSLATLLGCAPGVVAVATATRTGTCVPAREMARVGAHNQLGVVSLWAALRIDVFIVAALVSSAAFGVYTLAVSLAELVLLATDAIALAALGHQGRLDRSDAGRFSVQVASTAARVAVLQCAALAIVGWPLLRFAFGREWLSAFPIMLAMMPGMVALAYIRPLAVVFARDHRLLLRSRLLLGAAGLNVGGTLALVPILGTVGAGITASLAYGSAALLNARAMRRTFGLPAWGTQARR